MKQSPTPLKPGGAARLPRGMGPLNNEAITYPIETGGRLMACSDYAETIDAVSQGAAPSTMKQSPTPLKQGVAAPLADDLNNEAITYPIGIAPAVG